jgi:hypothetical protein
MKYAHEDMGQAIKRRYINGQGYLKDRLLFSMNVNKLSIFTSK